MDNQQVIKLNETEVIRRAVELTGISEKELLGGSQRRTVADVRKMCFFIIRNKIGHSERKYPLQRIGALFHQSHSTVIAALCSFNDLFDTDPNFKTQYHKLTQALGIENNN